MGTTRNCGLTASQRREFDRNGFLVLPGFVGDDACLRLRARALGLAEELATSVETATVFAASGQSAHVQDQYFLESGDQIRCFFETGAFGEDGELRGPAHLSLNKLGHAMHDLDPTFDQFSRTPELAEIAADLGFVSPLLLQSMYIFKQPHIGGEVNCHTDHTFLWTEPQSVIGFWFAIDDATVENGCMWAMPGGHRQPARSRFRRVGPGATRMEVIDPDPYPRDGIVPIEAERGTLVVLHGTLPHLSGPNNSDKPRHAYTLHVIEGQADYPADNWLRRDGTPSMRGFSDPAV